jgi:hypothetical protein
VLGGRAQAVAQRSHAAVGRALSRPPAREQALVNPEDGDADRVAVRLRAGVVPPQRDRQVAAGARRGRHQEVRLGEQLEVIARPSRAGLHEVPLIRRTQTRHLEDVDDVVHVALGEAERKDRPDEVGVAVEVVAVADSIWLT